MFNTALVAMLAEPMFIQEYELYERDHTVATSVKIEVFYPGTYDRMFSKNVSPDEDGIIRIKLPKKYIGQTAYQYHETGMGCGFGNFVLGPGEERRIIGVLSEPL